MTKAHLVEDTVEPLNCSKTDEDALDEALEETFPASDPVAITITPAEKAGVCRLLSSSDTKK
ncbi:hypothetical protein ACO0LB_14180 [Undibacterium sp. SXout7W]|uniref:hypothetical protein n=1 Tax=Undibacterium sp. SXout7W TaxID=3413049 RepID=UPI003BF3B02C